MEFSVAFYETSSGRCEESDMKQWTNFDAYLEDQLKNEDFAVRFKKAGEATCRNISTANQPS
jgi:hypothetical protein